MKLSVAQVALMNDALAEAAPDVLNTAARISRGEAVPDEDAEAVIDALAIVMLGEGFDGEDLTARGREIDDIVGIVEQMSEHFYD